jgi:ornithine--oxo-acid transaminase
LASDHDLKEHGLKPDILTLGKALSGGMTPASGIVADRELMACFTAGNQGSTFGGNPLTMAIVRASLEVLRDEGLVENAAERGEQLRAGFRGINSALLRDVRGRGLMNAIEVDRNSHVNGVDLCNIFQKYGVLTKATHDYAVRFTPPLVITAQEVEEVVQIVARSLEDLEKLNEQRANEAMFEEIGGRSQGATLAK